MKLFFPALLLFVLSTGTSALIIPRVYNGFESEAIPKIAFIGMNRERAFGYWISTTNPAYQLSRFPVVVYIPRSRESEGLDEGEEWDDGDIDYDEPPDLEEIRKKPHTFVRILTAEDYSHGPGAGFEHDISRGDFPKVTNKDWEKDEVKIIVDEKQATMVLLPEWKRKGRPRAGSASGLWNAQSRPPGSNPGQFPPPYHGPPPPYPGPRRSPVQNSQQPGGSHRPTIGPAHCRLGYRVLSHVRNYLFGRQSDCYCPACGRRL